MARLPKNTPDTLTIDDVQPQAMTPTAIQRQAGPVLPQTRFAQNRQQAADRYSQVSGLWERGIPVPMHMRPMLAAYEAMHPGIKGASVATELNQPPPEQKPQESAQPAAAPPWSPTPMKDNALMRRDRVIKPMRRF